MFSKWPDDAVVYQIYPRSFADSNGDGIGDIAGITAHVGHLSTLGVDAVWLNPFYPSPLADGGYDITDHRGVDPRLGTLQNFDELVSELHAHGIRVLVDIVPNHVSHEHPWFRAAVESPIGSQERARFHFRDGATADSPPNDWESAFGGPAWTQLPDGQWYFHLHAKEQPDLNWDHPEVRRDLLDTLRFWADRGVDGFRIDVANTLLKDLDATIGWAELKDRPTDDGRHPTSDRDGLSALQQEWRTLLDSYDPPRSIVAEAAVSRERRRRYAIALGQAFDFDMQDADFTPESYRAAITQGLTDAAATGRPATWLMGSHDTPRVASRYGLPTRDGGTARTVALQWLLSDGRWPHEDRALGSRRVRSALLTQLALPGVFYLFQGDELALPEVADLPSSVLQDPLATRSGGREKGRDGTRVPLPWTRARHTLGGSSFGFGPAGSHLPQPEGFSAHSVEAQAQDPRSTLSLVRRATALRRDIDMDSPLGWVEAHPSVLHFTRQLSDGQLLHCVTNMGTSPAELPSGEVLVSSEALVDGALEPDAAVWLRA